MADKKPFLVVKTWWGWLTWIFVIGVLHDIVQHAGKVWFGW